MRNWVRVFAAAIALGFAAGASAQDDQKKADDQRKNQKADDQKADRQRDDQKQDQDREEFTDENFVKKVASSNLLESKLGEIAQLKASRPNVRFFGKQMVMDHAAAMNALREVARDANVQIPEEMADKHKEVHTKFSEYKGENFDRDYMKQMVENHKKSLDLFTTAVKDAKNERVRTFAEKFRPIIEKHHEMAKKMHEELGGDKDTNRDNDKDRD